jgi:hypothetical protein
MVMAMAMVFMAFKVKNRKNGFSKGIKNTLIKNNQK